MTEKQISGNVHKSDRGYSRITAGAEYRGMNEAEVLESRMKHGRNSFTEKRSKGFLRRLLEGLNDPIIKILLGALIVTALIPSGDSGVLDAVGIAVAVAVATLVSTICEYGSEKAFKRMQREAGAQKCRVVRNGRTVEISISELVVGDIVRLRAGDKLPADGILIGGAVSCNLAALNGESSEQERVADGTLGDRVRRGEPVWDDAAVLQRTKMGIADDKSAVFRGSELTAGSGELLVTAVGDGTYYGRMASELQDDAGESPLKAKLRGLAGVLSKFGYFCAFFVGISDLLFKTVLNDSFVLSVYSVAHAMAHALTLSVSVVVMAVPEGLPMMITVVLASNMLRMQREHVMVRKLVGIETAGSMNILFTDKTGTITYGEPRVSGYMFGDGRLKNEPSTSSQLRRLIGLTAFYGGASTMDIVSGTRKAAGGDATDRAIMDAALSCGINAPSVERTAFLPFNSRDKLCAASVRPRSTTDDFGVKDGTVTLIKGAPEILLEYCEYAYGPRGNRMSIDKRLLRTRLEQLAAEGVRVLAAVTSECGEDAVRAAAEKALIGEALDVSVLFRDACFVCFVCLRDQIRAEASEAVSALMRAGIQTVMITGDNRLTAEAIAKEVGILPRSISMREAVFTGSEIAAMTDAELTAVLPNIRVIARALPQDKSRLVRVAKAAGLVVGMTGDGLNDAPALKLADVGFAMGSGTDMAKEAGDIVITDNNISSIVNAVLYGRTIFRSIRKFIVFQLTMNLCAVGISIIGPFIGYEAPVTVMQMLWINMIIDTLAALAFAGEAPMREYLSEPPVPKSQPVLSRGMLVKICCMGIYTVSLCTWFLTSPYISRVYCADVGDSQVLTGFFALFIFCGIIGSLNARTNRLNPFGGLFINPVFICVMCGVLTAQVAMIYYGGSIFGTVPLTARQLLTAALPSLTVLIAGRVFEGVRGAVTGKR